MVCDDSTSLPTPPARRPRRAPAHDGDNLFQDPRTGKWYWRRKHPTTGKRVTRPTGQTRRDLARRVAVRFDDEMAAEAAGVRTFEPFKGALAPLVDEWIEDLKHADRPPQKGTLVQKRRETLRALDALGLKVAADLTHVAAIDKKLRGLGVSRLKARRCYQDPLKAFSRWLASNQRRLPDDPLRSWQPIKPRAEERRAPRHAFMPMDVARALAALDVLDARLGRVGSSRLTFMVLLVAAPRAEALVTRDVLHFDAKGARVNMGDDVGNKLRGAGALDPATAAELKAAVKGRGAYEPLLVGPDGGRWPKERLLDVWRQGFSLGVVADLWPADEPRDLDLAVLVSRALLTGHVRVSKGGNPNLTLRDETVRARVELELRVARLVDAMKADWRARVDAVDVHSFRMNAQTWSEARGVPRPAIDKQLGHGGDARGSMDVLRAIAGSRTGRKSYLDLNSALFDPARVAVEVRTLLDEAEAQLRAEGSMLLTAKAGRVAAEA